MKRSKSSFRADTTAHAKIRERYQADPVDRPMGKIQQIHGLRKDGSEFPVDLSLRPMKSDGAVICIVRDTSDHVRLSNEIRETAYRDMVTGHAEPPRLLRTLAWILAVREQDAPGTCVAIFDLDHFKDINDSLGHQCGDELLAEFCNRLREIMHDDMRLYRIGGDEFAMIIPDCIDHSRASEFVDEAIRLVRRPYEIEGHRIGIGCSAGIVHAPTDGASAEELVSNADLALYDAKAVRGTSSVFTPRSARQGRATLFASVGVAGRRGGKPVRVAFPAPGRYSQRRDLWRRGAVALDASDTRHSASRPVHRRADRQ